MNALNFGPRDYDEPLEAVTDRNTLEAYALEKQALELGMFIVGVLTKKGDSTDLKSFYTRLEAGYTKGSNEWFDDLKRHLDLQLYLAFVDVYSRLSSSARGTLLVSLIVSSQTRRNVAAENDSNYRPHSMNNDVVDGSDHQQLRTA